MFISKLRCQKSGTECLSVHRIETLCKLGKVATIQNFQSKQSTLRYLDATISNPPSIIYTPFSITSSQQSWVMQFRNLQLLLCFLLLAVPISLSDNLASSSEDIEGKGRTPETQLPCCLVTWYIPWYFLSWRPLILNKTGDEEFCLDRGVRQVPWTKWPRRGRCIQYTWQLYSANLIFSLNMIENLFGKLYCVQHKIFQNLP